ncbi:MAG: hypothetical protein ACD_51C00327G0016 [uncultured bacterium]|nr:MAG: hypothetical protein ACD_51C00327G0016 [uncultured bacterium]OGJ48065.1 MAG: hypothetical protein A2244_01070 [Candidatus Peregrinibacteria bacterium RIFOXYA2_FULL_41_18]OGJ48277.1 MAG: hypothetical protein A2344_04065 [Candidatus Peregrinibacteria bacterium RIFOXYB12_FULL_41_12]OGJ53717.1 MAG: hypothetical protein A2448_01515 [Candidatus Peregrinibacteria bacterium RIFOXYC2_FULL_41_22]
MANIALQRAVDKYIGGAMCLGYSFLQHDKKPLVKEEVKEILIIRLWTLGETILTLPMIERIRKEYPHAKITVLARNANKAIFKNIDFIDDVLLFERENFRILWGLRGRFDLAIDTEPYLRVSGLLARFLGKKQIGFDHGVRGKIYSQKVRYDDHKHAAELFCDLLKPIGIEYKPNTLVRLKSTDISAKIESMIGKSLNEARVIGMHASTADSAKYRAWPIKNFAELASKIIDENANASVVLTGSPSEHKLNEEIIKMCAGDRKRIFNLAGVLSFEEFIGLFDCLDVFVSNDTGPMHLSAAQGCKTIGLFGPNLPSRFGPYPLDNGTNFAIYHGDRVPCSPCINVHTGCFKKCRRMKDGTGECMALIGMEEVYEQVKKTI